MGDMVTWVKDLHEKYGEVVRITPDELSFISPSAWQDIYTTKPQLPKVSKGVFRSYNGVASLATETVTESHTRQRRILSHAFSERALREQEDILEHYTDLLVTKLKEQIASTEKGAATLDIGKWYNFTTFDIIGDLLFNDPFHSLEDEADHPWVEAVWGGLVFGIILSAFTYFPPLPALVDRMMPQSIRDKAKEHFYWSQQKITRRIETETNRPDFMTYILGNNKGEERMTRDEIDSNGSFLILAGSETSAVTSSSSTYFMLKHPVVFERLKKEVREAFTSMDEITVAATGGLPYLHAVITEALRLHPPAAVGVPRMVDRPDVVVSGHQIPVGVRLPCPRSYNRPGQADESRHAAVSQEKLCIGHHSTLWNPTHTLLSGGFPRPIPSTTPIAKQRLSLSWLDLATAWANRRQSSFPILVGPWLTVTTGLRGLR